MGMTDSHKNTEGFMNRKKHQVQDQCLHEARTSIVC